MACMEDVLDLYEEPPDPKRPKVCFDETSKQLVAETRAALPAEPGRLRRYDYEYRRNGVRNLFMFFEPQQGWRHVAVTGGAPWRILPTRCGGWRTMPTPRPR